MNNRKRASWVLKPDKRGKKAFTNRLEKKRKETSYLGGNQGKEKGQPTAAGHEGKRKNLL